MLCQNFEYQKWRLGAILAPLKIKYRPKVKHKPFGLDLKSSPGGLITTIISAFRFSALRKWPAWSAASAVPWVSATIPIEPYASYTLMLWHFMWTSFLLLLISFVCYFVVIYRTVSSFDIEFDRSLRRWIVVSLSATIWRIFVLSETVSSTIIRLRPNILPIYLDLFDKRDWSPVNWATNQLGDKGRSTGRHVSVNWATKP